MFEASTNSDKDQHCYHLRCKRSPALPVAVSVRATLHLLCRSRYAWFSGYAVLDPWLISVILLVSDARNVIRYCKACPAASTRSGEEPWPSTHCQWYRLLCQVIVIGMGNCCSITISSCSMLAMLTPLLSYFQTRCRGWQQPDQIRLAKYSTYLKDIFMRQVR